MHASWTWKKEHLAMALQLLKQKPNGRQEAIAWSVGASQFCLGVNLLLVMEMEARGIFKLASALQTATPDLIQKFEKLERELLPLDSALKKAK